MSDLYTAMFDATVRLEAAWPFPMSPAPEALIEAFADRLDGGKLPEALHRFVKGWSEDEIEALYDGGWQASDAFDDICASAFCASTFGWIGIAATPVMTPTGSGGASLSWGHYYTELLFAPTADELLKAAVEWAEARHTDDCKPGAGTADAQGPVA